MSLGRNVYIAALGAAIALTISPPVDSGTRERIRIQAHFDSVIAELRARDVTSLDVGPRVNRARLIATLEAYRDRGEFPHNYDFPGELVPTFVDEKTGVVCAVGHLLESTGRRDIVDRVARSDNHVWVAELASDTAVKNWLSGSGLTLAEAARIQVPYWNEGPEEGPTRSEAGGMSIGDPTAFLLGISSAALAGANLANNRKHEYPVLGALGATTGVVTTIVGQLMLKNGRGTANLARAATGVGIASAVIGTIRLMPIAKEPSNAISVSPSVTLPGESSSARVGLSGSIRF